MPRTIPSTWGSRKTPKTTAKAAGRKGGKSSKESSGSIDALVASNYDTLVTHSDGSDEDDDEEDEDEEDGEEYDSSEEPSAATDGAIRTTALDQELDPESFVYSGTGDIDFKLRPGKYMVVTRGTDYSAILVGDLAEREVHHVTPKDTPAYVLCGKKVMPKCSLKATEKSSVGPTVVVAVHCPTLDQRLLDKMEAAIRKTYGKVITNSKFADADEFSSNNHTLKPFHGKKEKMLETPGYICYGILNGPPLTKPHDKPSTYHNVGSHGNVTRVYRDAVMQRIRGKAKCVVKCHHLSPVDGQIYQLEVQDFISTKSRKDYHKANQNVSDDSDEEEDDE